MAVNTATKLNVATRDGVVFQTNNADLQTAITFPTRTNKVYWVDIKVVAIRTDTYDEAASYWKQGCFRNDNGTLTQVGATRDVVTDNEDAGGWQCLLDANSTNIRLRVAGTGNTVNWLISSDIKEMDNVPQT